MGGREQLLGVSAMPQPVVDGEDNSVIMMMMKMAEKVKVDKKRMGGRKRPYTARKSEKEGGN